MWPGLGEDKELNLWSPRHKSWHMITHADHGLVLILFIQVVLVRANLGLSGTMFGPSVNVPSDLVPAWSRFSRFIRFFTRL